MKLRLLLFFALTLAAIPAFSQMKMDTELTPVVDDLVARKMLFLVTCSHPSDSPDEKRARASHLASWKLNDSTHAGKILAEFCEDYDKAVEDYNSSIANDKSGPSPLQADFQLGLNALIQKATSQLRKIYGNEWDDVDKKLLKEEKPKMRIQENSPMVMSSVTHPMPHLVTAQESLGTYTSTGYTAYDTASWDGTNLYHTILVNGTSSQQWSCQYVQTGQYTWTWQPPGCPVTILHTPTITNQINMQSVTVSGASVTPSQYMSFQNTTQMAVAQTPDSTITGTITSTLGIWCPLGKMFFQFFNPSGYLLAFEKTVCVESPNYAWVMSYCTEDTVPPLINVTSIPGGEVPYYNNWAFCTKHIGDVHYSCTKTALSLRTSNPARGKCTPLAGN